MMIRYYARMIIELETVNKIDSNLHFNIIFCSLTLYSLSELLIRFIVVEVK